MEANQEKLLEIIERYGLEAPALFFGELFKPLGGFFASNCDLLRPTLAPFVGFERWDSFRDLLGKPEAYEGFLRLIEERAAACKE